MSGLALHQVLPQIRDRELETRKYVNFLLTLMARRRRDTTVRTRPIDVTIDPSTLCQLRCPYCDVGNATIRRARTLLSPTVHRGFVEELAKELFVAWYFSTGEPLLNRRLAELIRSVTEHGVFTIVSTNLSLKLSDARLNDLLTSGLGILSVSLDGASPETYRRYRVGGDFDRVLDNIRRLVQRRKELGLERPLIEWRFLVFRHNQHELDAARQLAAELDVDLLEFFSGSAPEDAGVDSVQRAVEPDLDTPVSGAAYRRGRARRDTTLRSLLADSPEEFGASAPVETRGRKCDWLYFGPTLFPNGAVSPCCISNHEPDDFGTVDADHSFSQVWNNTQYRDARRLFATGSAESPVVCARCPLPSAQDYQFRMSLRGILLNAPDWVLMCLSQDMSRFFFDVDYHLSPSLFAPLRDGSLRAQLSDTDLAYPDWTAQTLPEASDIAWLRETCGIPP